MNSLREQLGDQIAKVRKARSFSQEELGAHLQIAQPSISRAEKGKAVSTEILTKICDFLEIDCEVERLDLILAFCSNPECLGSTPFVSGTRILARPTFYLVKPESSHYCQLCAPAQLLHANCPCGRTVAVGIACPDCGLPYVSEVIISAKDKASLDLEVARILKRNLVFFPSTGFPSPIIHGTDFLRKAE